MGHLDDPRGDTAPGFRGHGRRVANACVLVLALAAAGVVASCRARPIVGTTCRTPDALTCSDLGHALLCDGMTWREVPCRGRHGCSHHAGNDDCDDELALVGDPCPHSPAVDYACSLDHKAALECKDGLFSLWRHCRGEGGCRLVGDRRLDCDTTLSETDDPCEKKGTYSCSTDRKAMLECDGRSFLTVATCRGVEGCRFDADTHKVDCSDAVALEGDPCEDERRITCNADGKSELVCQGNRYVRKRECRRMGCRVEGSELYCD